MKTILDLCKDLPDSEAELRARAGEFNLAVEQALHIPTRWAARNYVDNIADAAAATDVIVALGWQFDCGTIGYASDEWAVTLRPRQGVDKPHKFDRECVSVEAATEPLARSAAAYLAAMAMEGGGK